MNPMRSLEEEDATTSSMENRRLGIGRLRSGETIEELIEDFLQDSSSSSPSSSGGDISHSIMLIWTILLGTVGVVWLWRRRQQKRSNSSSDTALSVEERRAHIMEARLRTLEQQQSKAPQLSQSPALRKTLEDATTRQTTPGNSSILREKNRPSIVVVQPPEPSGESSKEWAPPAQANNSDDTKEDDKSVAPLLTRGKEVSTKVPTKKRQKRHAPPVQVVCETLSWILQPVAMTITVEPHEAAKSWGGVGWWKPSPDQRHSKTYFRWTQSTHRLDLHSSYRAELEDDWDAVCQSIQDRMGDGRVWIKENGCGVRDLLELYTRAELIRTRRENRFVMVESSWVKSFASMAKAIQQACVQGVADRLERDDSFSNSSQKHNDSSAVNEDLNSLFSDDYDTSIATSATQNSVSELSSDGDWHAFLHLLTGKESSINDGRFLEDLIILDESWRTKLVQLILEALRSPNSHFVANRLVILSSHIRQLSAAWSQEIRAQEVETMKDSAISGRNIEAEFLLLTPLLRTVATAFAPMQIEIGNDCQTRWMERMVETPDFPASVFRSPQPKEIGLVFQQFRQESRQTRGIVESWMKLALKEDKMTVFKWVQSIISKSVPLSSLAKSELLEGNSTSKVQSCPSHAFLLGLTSSWIELCGQSLVERFSSTGVSAFDATFLSDNSHHLVSNRMLDSCLFGGPLLPLHSSTSSDSGSPVYSGSTYFFFLSCHLLRVALQSGVKMEHEFYRSNSHAIEAIRNHETAANKSSTVDSSNTRMLPERFLKQMQPTVAAWLGCKAFLEDPDFVAGTVNFSLLQLQWTLAACRMRSRPFVPEWMVKDPSRWLAEVAHRVPRHLKSTHADQAVEVCTELLEVGNTVFSPVVVTCLIRITLAFVRAGVQRAKQRQRHRRSRAQQSTADLEGIDDRDLDIYSSFDPGDLGVAVFANKLVTTRLCPTLIRTFEALDVAQVDMDLEHDFDKFRAKNEVADLLLRLWWHPNGECRESIVKGVQPSDWNIFATSCVSALSVNLDDAVQKLATTLSTIRNNRSQSDQRFIDLHSSYAAGGLAGARRILLLLCTLSEEEPIAASLGGRGDDKASIALANAIVHFLDILTGEDGGTQRDLEYGLNETTSSIFNRTQSMSAEEIALMRRQVKVSRQFCQEEIGLDISIFCHQFLGLAARWHTAAASGGKESPILHAIAFHDDVDVDRYEAILHRLIMPSSRVVQGDSDFFHRDGFIPSNVPRKRVPATTAEGKQRQLQAQVDQMKHSSLEQQLASSEVIGEFIGALRVCIAKRQSCITAPHGDDIEATQKLLLANNSILADDEYGSQLADWVVSSSPFANPSDATKFLHFYNRTVQARDASRSGKELVKEARKCYKNLPQPHANSSCFVCFAEERMDLCRAVVTGPVGTPYALGIFVFDVYFPLEYPSVPPLVTFMTTGGGQIRFSPNLYVDGKVCLSLLGLTFAQDESQRWNPMQSSLAQILLSMQAQIFGVEEPYFNEGSGTSDSFAETSSTDILTNFALTIDQIHPGIPLQQRTTPAGREGSRKHNSMLRLATLRHAIVAHLKSPPVGMEEITRRHFAMCRQRVLVQARRWMLEDRETNGGALYRRFEKVYRELISLLSELEDAGPCLLPLKDDLEYVQRFDPMFRDLHLGSRNEKSPSTFLNMESPSNPEPNSANGTALNPSDRSDEAPAAYNPWTARTQTEGVDADDGFIPQHNDDSDDELYL